jgi:2-iminobutanoate/2-iminopropanoate deaminase
MHHDWQQFAVANGCLSVSTSIAGQHLIQIKKNVGDTNETAIFKRRGCMTREVISTARAPQPIVPLSQAIRANGFVFVSGTVSRNAATGKIEGSNIQEQTKLALENIQAVLEAAGTSLKNSVRVTAFLRDRNDFAAFNEAYGKYFPVAPPARAVVQAADFMRPEILVEIELTAVMP